MGRHEDLFGDGAIEVVIRFKSNSIEALNRQGNGTFDDIQQWIHDNTIQYVFGKKNEKEHSLRILIKKINKSIDLTLAWEQKTFDYSAVINYKTKRIINEYDPLEINDYFISEDVDIKFIGFDEANRSDKDLENLYDRICLLEVSPKFELDNQKNIWNQWIEAQKLIVDNNAKAIEVSGFDIPIEVSPTRWQFRVKLKQEEQPEYSNLARELKKEPFQIDAQFSPDGSINLKLDDIYNGIDRVLEKKFSKVIERDNYIGCILKIKPYRLSDRINNDTNYKFNIYQKPLKRALYAPINHPAKQTMLLIRELFFKGFKLNKYKGSFKVDWHKNINLDKEFISENNITFDETEKSKLYLPEPIQNCFIKSENSLEKLYSLYNELSSIFNPEKISSNVVMVFVPFSSDVVFESNFDDEFWLKLKRELYSLDFDASASQTSETIYFEFSNSEELKNRFNQINRLDSAFKVILYPFNTNFEFKVKTNLIAKKSQKIIFQERLKALSSEQFTVCSDGEKNDSVIIGNLSHRNSDYNNLVFDLPCKHDEDVLNKDKLLDYLEDKPILKFVKPNLHGDQAKLSWLNEAMNKVNNPIDKLDKKPVNGKLQDFIFDSSKAEEVFRDLSEESEDWKDLERHELLILNKSQRRAVLSSLHSKDLALLQGPPGTGKTTVIAEMIWQMIRVNQNQKILLTSETNLAVDNAIEKMLNVDHTLVKPIRFGKAVKFEEEGRKYSFERIMMWVNQKQIIADDDQNEGNNSEEKIAESDVALSNNAVQIWMRRIAENSQQSNSKYSEVMKYWAYEMAQPKEEMRALFRDKYFKYCNVVGSTSSSAGSPGFAADYQRIFNECKKVTTTEGDYEIGAFTKTVKNLMNRYTKFNGRFKGVNGFEKIQRIEFDTVITDEASKATPPELLLPMCFGHKNIVIGDHRQLPPMLHDKSFREILETLDTPQASELAAEIDKEFVETSQFERLISHPKVPSSIKSSFNEQYRMHPQINNVIKQFYLEEGGLEPGKPIIEHANDPNLDNPFSRHHGFVYDGFIKPQIHTIWVNVDAPEEKSGTSRINQTEVEAISMVLKILKDCGGFKDYMNHWDNIKDANKRLEEREIGLISFYGHQVRQLDEVAKQASAELDIPVRLNTVDKFQGMERNIIIVSTVRSNEVIDNGKVFKNQDIGFAKSPQRLNVALSRAKRLLIVVGNKNFFARYQNKNGERIYKNVIDIIENEGLVINYDELKQKFRNAK